MERLCHMSSDLNNFQLRPRQAIADHGIEEGQELAHGGDDDDLGGFPPRLSALVLLIFVAMACAGLGGCQNVDTLKIEADTAFLDINDQRLNPLRDPSGASVRVLIFITADCPISNGYAPEINRLVVANADRGVAFTLVQVDRDLTVEQARKHALEYGFRCPVILDPQHRLVKAVGATVTPEAAVIDRQDLLVYRGRIDDQYVDLGKKRMEASQHDLQAAIDAVLRGEKVSKPRTKAVGCFIPEPAK